MLTVPAALLLTARLVIIRRKRLVCHAAPFKSREVPAPPAATKASAHLSTAMPVTSKMALAANSALMSLCMEVTAQPAV